MSFEWGGRFIEVVVKWVSTIFYEVTSLELQALTYGRYESKVIFFFIPVDKYDHGRIGRALNCYSVDSVNIGIS